MAKHGAAEAFRKEQEVLHRIHQLSDAATQGSADFGVFPKLKASSTNYANAATASLVTQPVVSPVAAGMRAPLQLPVPLFVQIVFVHIITIFAV